MLPIPQDGKGGKRKGVEMETADEDRDFIMKGERELQMGGNIQEKGRFFLPGM